MPKPALTFEVAASSAPFLTVSCSVSRSATRTSVYAAPPRLGFFACGFAYESVGKTSAVSAHRANRTNTWPRCKCPKRFPRTPGGNSSEVTRSMRRFFLLPVDITLNYSKRMS